MANSHAIYKGTSQTVHLVYLDRKVPADQLRETFEQYCRENPLLLSKLTVRNKKWCLQTRKDASSHFETVKFDRELTDLDLILEEEVNDVIDYAQSLSRLKLIYLMKNEGCLIVLAQHHAITDSYSARKILFDVINLLDMDGNEAGNEYDALPVWYESDISQFDFVDSVGKNGHMTSELAVALKEIDNDMPVKRTAVYSWVVDSDQIVVLMEYADQLQSTLNSLLTVILSMGVMELLNIYRINTYSAVTQREANNEFTDQLGCMFDIVNIDISAWDLDDAVRRFERGINYIKKHVDVKEEANSLISAKARAQNLSVEKSIGLCKGLQFMHDGCVDTMTLNGDIKVLAYRAIANLTSGCALFTFHMSFHKGSLIISAVSSQLILSKKMMRMFIDNINRYIEAVGCKARKESMEN